MDIKPEFQSEEFSIAKWEAIATYLDDCLIDDVF